jgi:hypothetical protein
MSNALSARNAGSPPGVRAKTLSPHSVRVKTICLAATAAFLLAGCASPHLITLNSGSTITTRNKPRLNESGDAFIFKTTAGQTGSVPAGRVKEIAPR